MPIPDFQTLMLPTLRRIFERRWRTAELIGSLSDEFGLTADERAQLLPSGRQPTIANRTHWSIAYLNRAGLITRVGRGEYEVSPSGRALLDDPPARITTALLSQRFPAVRSFREPNADVLPTNAKLAVTTPPETDSPDDAINRALATIEAKVRDDFLDRILEAPAKFFEKVVVDLLLAMGYGSTAEDAGQVIGGTGDGGVDGVIREDRLGLDLIYVQAKRYRDTPISADNLRSFAGALDDKGARKGVFMTTSRFTADAESFAQRQQMKRIVLIDGTRLTQLMLRHDVGVRTDRTVVLKRLDLDYFDQDAG